MRTLKTNIVLGALLCAVLSLFSTVAVAQEAPKFQAFAGYSFERVEDTNLHGVNGAVSFNPYKSFGVVSDYSLHFGPLDSTFQTLTFGPQVYARRGSYTLFARGLAGGTRVGALGASGYAFAFGGGGGLDVPITDGIGVRVVQFDYLANRNAGVTVNGFRISTGFVFGK